ncbi:MAG: DNA primase [Gammaproteobacteria bacterium]|nr:DNA primase [Gammaproteobacteria bacterium]
MAGRIPQHFIDSLINQVDIVDVIDARVPLKKKGHEYTACCPFHNEKTPSFTVSQQKQFYHCFGCGAHGTAIGFLMEYENMEFVDAIEQLAADHHIDVPREDSQIPQGPDNTGVYNVLELAAEQYQLQLRQSQRAIDYLKKRGLSGDISKDYGIGYAPDSWDFILKQAPSAAAQKDLATGGMLIEKNGNQGNFYDRFRDRIMFPIRDRRGRTIGFGGRILDQGEPKYLNSPETPVFHKGKELYGLYEAKKSVRNLDMIVIVEGYMDVVALAQNGIRYAVATLGTATTAEQISLILRSVKKLVFCYDGDRAGKKAAWKALENTLPLMRDGYEIRFLFLPDGEDPDTMVRQEGQQAFELRLQNATPLSDFLIKNLEQQTDMSSMDGRAHFAELAKPLLNKLPESIFKDLLNESISKEIGLHNKRLVEAKPARLQQSPSAESKGRQLRITNVRLAIGLMLQQPSLVSAITLPQQLRHAQIQGIGLFFELYELIRSTPELSSAAILERMRGHEMSSYLNKLLHWQIPDADDKETCLIMYQHAVRNLTQEMLQHRYEFLENKSLSSALSDDEMNEFRSLLKLKALYDKENENTLSEEEKSDLQRLLQLNIG